MKIRELIAELQRFDPERGVAVVAACCEHPHDVHVIEESTEDSNREQRLGRCLWYRSFL
jgi:uncharacterized protein YwlG (UPF0340 family)